jgi:hypothetical protein
MFFGWLWIRGDHQTPLVRWRTADVNEAKPLLEDSFLQSGMIVQ